MKITIVIPVYNGDKYLHDCIQSCLNQTYTDLIVLLVNDGSTDKSQEIIDAFSRKDSRVFCIYQENKGLVEARKIGVRNITTEYFIFLDADDKLTTNALQSLNDILCKTKADIIFSNFYVERENGSLLFCSNNSFPTKLESIDVLRSILRKDIYPPIWGRLIKTSLFLRTDTPSDLTIAEDAAVWVQLLSYNPTIAYTDDYIYHYIQRQNSMVHQFNTITQQKRLRFLRWFLDFISNNYPKIEMSEDLNIFIINEIFSFVRDGGNLNTIKELYVQSIREVNFKTLADKLGYQRIFMLFLFDNFYILGLMYRDIYLRIRKLRYWAH